MTSATPSREAMAKGAPDMSDKPTPCCETCPDPVTHHRFDQKWHIGAGSCWVWQAASTRGGYANMNVRGKMWRAARWSYEHFVGPIRCGLQIDHLCKNVRCVNPRHLETVTPRENCLRSSSFAARLAKQTHCIHGHELAGDNLQIRASGARVCRECKRRLKREHYRRNAKQMQAKAREYRRNQP